jgi:hypothetical protein
VWKRRLHIYNIRYKKLKKSKTNENYIEQGMQWYWSINSLSDVKKTDHVVSSFIIFLQF